MAARSRKVTSKEHPRLGGKSKRSRSRLVHPIVVYPFTHPKVLSDIESLYTNLIAKLNEDKETYSTPLTVMNRQTFYNNTKWTYDPQSNKQFEEFRKDVVERNSTIVDTWAVDTCQMWLAGFGKAFDEEENTGDDVYWLIPGDFNYDKKRTVLNKLLELPRVVSKNEQDLCLGEVSVDVNNSKQLIDTYGTYGLLYNWFPHQAQEIRRLTDKPRTEFLAISHGFLRETLRRRWYAYEQTIIILLQAIIAKKRVHTVGLGDMSDLPQGRDTLAAAMQQVERTERALKLFWREQNQNMSDWADRFRKLDAQSEQIRGAALVILENLLTYP